MKVLIVEANPILAMWIARQCESVNSWSVGVFTRVLKEEVPYIQERRMIPTPDGLQEAWFSMGAKLLQNPQEVHEWAPDMILNFSMETSSIAHRMSTRLEREPLVFNCGSLNTSLHTHPDGAQRFLVNAGVPHYPFKFLAHEAALAEWLARYDCRAPYLQIESPEGNLTVNTQAVQGMFSYVTEWLRARQWAPPYLVRESKSSKMELLKFGILFTGKSYVGNPFSVVSSKNSLIIAHLGEDAKDLVNDLFERLQAMLIAVRFTGVVFLEIDKLTGQLYRIDTQQPEGFWYLYLESLNQSIPRFLFSCAKGVPFSPEVLENRIGAISPPGSFFPHDGDEAPEFGRDHYVRYNSADGSNVLVRWFQATHNGYYRPHYYSSMTVSGLADRPLCSVQLRPFDTEEPYVVVGPEHLPDPLVYGLMIRPVYASPVNEVESEEVEPTPPVEPEKVEEQPLCQEDSKEVPAMDNKSISGNEAELVPLPSPPEPQPSLGRRSRKVRS